MSTGPTVAQTPNATTSKATTEQFDTYLTERSKGDINNSKSRNQFNTYLTAGIVPFIGTLGIILFTIFASTQLDQPLGLTHTFTLGAYSTLAILAITATWMACINYALHKVHQNEDERSLRMRLQTLDNMLKLGGDNKTIVLQNFHITDDMIKNKQGEVRQALQLVLNTKDATWKVQNNNVKDALRAVAMGLLTISGTIFASQYLPLILAPATAVGATIGTFVLGAGMTAMYISHKASSKETQKFIPPWIETTALFILALVGTIFLSEYLPRIMDNTLAQGISAMFGLSAFTATILSLMYRCMEEKEGKDLWKWIKPMLWCSLTVVAIIAAAVYLPSNLSTNFTAGTSGVIGAVGLTGAVGSFVYRILKATENSRVYSEKNRAGYYYSGYSYYDHGITEEQYQARSTDERAGYIPRYDSNQIVGLKDRKGDERTNFIAAYKKINLKNNTKLGILSWWVPLVIIMVGITLSCLAIGEFGSELSKPYLFTATVLLSVALATSHIVHTSLTAKYDKELFEETLSAIREPKEFPALGR